MKHLQEYIFENLFTNEYIHHKNKKTKQYDYGPTVINMLIKGKELKLGDKGDKGTISIKDFNEEKLTKLLSIFGTRTWQEDLKDFNDAYNDKSVNNIWKKIFKGDISGQYRKIGGGMSYEQNLCDALCELILTNNLDKNNIVYKSAINLWNKISTHKTIKYLQSKNLSNEDIKKYVFVSGKGSTARNNGGGIIDDNFEISAIKSKDIENEIKTILEQSGKIIADITITINDNFNKSSEYTKDDADDIYISCKDGQSQLSGIEICQPFYGKYGKTKEESLIIKCFKQNIPYNKFIKLGKTTDEKTNINSFISLCNFFKIDPKNVYDYFKVDSENRDKHFQIKTYHTNPGKDVDLDYSYLIQLIIGGNYYYVNSDGSVKYIDNNIKDINFIPHGNAYFDSKQIVVKGDVKINNETINNCAFKFRNSSGGNYPCRLFFYYPPSNHFIADYY